METRVLPSRLLLGLCLQNTRQRGGISGELLYFLRNPGAQTRRLVQRKLVLATDPGALVGLPKPQVWESSYVHV